MTMAGAPPRDLAQPDPSYPVRVDALAPNEFSWRLTASNGRSIARSALTFGSGAAALTALDDLATTFAAQPLPGTIGHRPGGGWGWTMNDDQGRPVARSPRTFERHGSCARSLQLFRSALTTLATATRSDP